MSKAKVTDILLLGFISGVVAILTSMMGISGTIIGAVVTSIIAESLKTYLKEPLKDKINNYEKQNKVEKSRFDYDRYDMQNQYNIPSSSGMPRPRKHQRKVKETDGSFLTAKILFIFPLIIILIIELIHFLGAIHIIPYDIFYSLESITNWRLLRTIGYALIIMGIYPIISKKFSTFNGILLIIIGIIELMFGYADVSSRALMFTSLISSLREYVNIGIILAILYTILTIHDESSENNNEHTYNF